MHSPFAMQAATPPGTVARPHVAWPPRHSQSADALIWVAIGIAGTAILAFGVAVGQPPGSGRVAALLAAALLGGLGLALAAWGTAYRRLLYTLGPEALEVHWLGSTTRVPYSGIDSIDPGQRLVGSSSPRLPSWPGIYVGPGRLRGVGRLRFFATTRDPSELTLVRAGSYGLVVSARDPLAFRSALTERVARHERAAKPRERIEWQPPTTSPWTALRDTWLLVPSAAGLLALLLAVAVISAAHPSLPERLPLRFDAAGLPSDLASRDDLFRVPLLGLGILLVNSVAAAWMHATEPVVARILSGGALAVQLVALVALARLVQA